MTHSKALRQRGRTHHVLMVGALWVATGLISMPASAEPADWVYAPLPLENESLTLARNQPLAALLTTILERPVQLRLYPTYHALIEAVAGGEVDFAELGPLPFLLARERVPHLRPVATFREPDGRAEYRCVIAAPVDGIVSLQHLMHQPTPPSVALTRPQSTCGPTVIFWLLVAHGFDLAHIHAAYHGGHDDVAIAVLREQFLIGGMKDSVAQRFYGLGLRTLATSDPVPGFMLVAQPDTLSAQQWATLTQTLTDLDDARLHTLQNGRYGFAPVDEQALEPIKTMRRLTAVFLNRVAD